MRTSNEISNHFFNVNVSKFHSFEMITLALFRMLMFRMTELSNFQSTVVLELKARRLETKLLVDDVMYSVPLGDANRV